LNLLKHNSDTTAKNNNPISKETKKNEGTTKWQRSRVCEAFGVMEGKPWLHGSAIDVHGGVDRYTFMVGFRSWSVGVGNLRYFPTDWRSSILTALTPSNTLVQILEKIYWMRSFGIFEVRYIWGGEGRSRVI